MTGAHVLYWLPPIAGLAGALMMLAAVTVPRRLRPAWLDVLPLAGLALIIPGLIWALWPRGGQS
jgi:hypothetical protein